MSKPLLFQTAAASCFTVPKASTIGPRIARSFMWVHWHAKRVGAVSA